MTSQLPLEIATRYLDAIESGNFELARSCLDDHKFTYRSPVFNCDSADEFISTISHIGSILDRIERRRTFIDGNEVCHVLDFVTMFSTVKVTAAMQWTTVKDGKIVSMEAVFDGRAYREMFIPEGE